MWKIKGYLQRLNLAVIGNERTLISGSGIQRQMSTTCFSRQPYLTTHQVVCLDQALQVIKWYRWRWRIEQLFATLKCAGLDLETTQLESTSAIKRLTILALSVATRTLQMVEGRDNSELEASLIFSSEQQQCLSTR